MNRLLWTVVVLFGVSLIAFVLIRLVPGDVVDIVFQSEAGRTSEHQARMREFFGLDQSFISQFTSWSTEVLKGNLGHSFRTNRSVVQEMLPRASVTFEMILYGLLFSLLLGIPTGIASALGRGGWFDNLLRPLAVAGLSVPSFWVGTLLLLAFSLYLPQIRVLGYTPMSESLLDNARVMLLPGLALGIVSGAALSRITRSSLLETLSLDYVRTARAKGLPFRRVVIRHALRNALIPVVTLLGIELGTLIGGSVILEEVFALPGLGRLILTAIKQRDYPIVQGVILSIAIVVSLINLVVDLVYMILDPRIRYQ